MAEVKIQPVTRGFRKQCEGWTYVKVRFGEVEDLLARKQWCSDNVGDRYEAWDVMHLGHFYFRRKHHALMFKLAFGGK